MSYNASVVEILWSLAGALATILHFYLTVQAWLDWRVSADAVRLRLAPDQRAVSACWFFVGQSCLFLPALGEFGIGVLAMMTPPPIGEEVRDAVLVSQVILIVGKWIGAGAALAFWMSRRALESWSIGGE
jgi:hypothetical protein